MNADRLETCVDIGNEDTLEYCHGVTKKNATCHVARSKVLPS